MGDRLAVAILVGLLIAFAVQFLLTNLGLALGISALKYRPRVSEAPQSSQNDKTVVNISFLAGLGILLTLNFVLFVACFLAVRFSMTSDPISGATLGIVIWSTYFLILIWVSYSTVGSLVGWVFGSLASNLRQLIEAIYRAIRGVDEPNSTLLKEGEAANLINREVQTALNEFDLKERIEDYLGTVPPPQLDLQGIGQGFGDMLAKFDLESLAGTNLLQKIDRQTFIDLIDERTKLSSADAERVVDRLESIWQKAVDSYGDRDFTGELLDWLNSVNPEALQFEELTERLEGLEGSAGKESGKISSSIATWWEQIDWRAAKSALLERVDLSEVEIEDIWHGLQSLYHRINPAEESLKLPFNTIANDAEDYLWHAPPWYLNSEKGLEEFKQVIYDPQADPLHIRSQLEQIQIEDLLELLKQRDNLDREKIDRIAERLETARQEVFALIERAQLQQQVETELQTVELAELEDDNLLPRLEKRLIELGVSTEALIKFLRDWQQLDWQTWLQKRQDLSSNQLNELAEKLKKMGDRLLERIEDWQVRVAASGEDLRDRLKSYLRYTHVEHLTPEKIDAKLEKLWQEISKNLTGISSKLPQIDRFALIETLERRKGLDRSRIEEIVEQIETQWQKLNPASTQEISPLQMRSVEVSEKLIDYLYQAIEQNLNLEEIQEDLPKLLNFAQQETGTLVNRQLAQLNWDEIEEKLKQFEKYNETQIKRAIAQVREIIAKLIKLPRRWATRTSRKVKDTIDELKDFLSYGDKSEFTVQHLDRNLKSILSPSKARSHLSSHPDIDRLTQLTPETIGKSLSLREDLTPVEIEEIRDRFTGIAEGLIEEIKTKQIQASQLVRHSIDRIGEYLSSLNLFALDYDEIKAKLANFDFQELTASWKAIVKDIPVEEVGDRLGTLSHDTLLKIVRTSEPFSDAIFPQIGGVRDYIVEQIEAIKIKSYQQAETIKQQTLQQVEASRQAIAAGAYWICAISFTSAITAALAGFWAATSSL